MEKIRARVPWVFFDNLLPFNAELLNGNAMLVRACGAKPSDGTILRSKEYLLFGNGIATLLPLARAGLLYSGSANRNTTLVMGTGSYGYIMEFTQKRDPRGVSYWEVQSVVDQMPGNPNWRLEVSDLPPISDKGWHIRKLIEREGKPGQFIYLCGPA